MVLISYNQPIGIALTHTLQSPSALVCGSFSFAPSMSFCVGHVSSPPPRTAVEIRPPISDRHCYFDYFHRSSPVGAVIVAVAMQPGQLHWDVSSLRPRPGTAHRSELTAGGHAALCWRASGPVRNGEIGLMRSRKTKIKAVLGLSTFATENTTFRPVHRTNTLFRGIVGTPYLIIHRVAVMCAPGKSS